MSHNKLGAQKEFIDVASTLDFLEQRTSKGVIPDCSKLSAKSSEEFDESVLSVKHATTGIGRHRKLTRASLRDHNIIENNKLVESALQKVASKVGSPPADSNDVSEHWSPGRQSDDSSNDTAHWFQDSQSANDKNIEIKTEDTSASEQCDTGIPSPDIKSKTSTPKVKPFACVQCDERFSTNATLKQHTRTKHKQDGEKTEHPCERKGIKSKAVGEKPYVCSECNRGFVRAVNLKEHQRVKHNGGSRYDCKECGVRFTNAKDSKQHKRVAHKAAVAETAVSPELFTCTLCDKQLTDLALHNRRIHSTVREFHCEPCNKWFFTSTELKQHFIRKHTDERPYLCPRCGERFAVMTDMQHHLVIHSATRRMFPCEMCTNTYTSLAQLKVHIRIHNDERIFACTQCEMKFVSSSHANRHKRRVHEKNRYACAQCERTFGYIGELTSHMLTHAPTRSYGCSQCDKTFKLNSYLQTHIKSVHSNDRTALLCNICGKTFTTKGSLTVHRQLHTGERRYTCPNCDKKFTKLYDVKVHVRQVHTNERPYACGQCGRRFASRGNMKNHEQIHNGKELYGCTQCDEKFVFRNSLPKHFEQQHSTGRYISHAVDKGLTTVDL